MSIPCSAVSSRTGEPCRRWAIEGGTVCPAHGGSAPATRRRARERAAEAELTALAARLDSGPVADPVAWYSQVAGEVNDFLTVCRERLTALASLDYRDAAGVEGVRSVVTLYERALDRAEKTASNLIRLGIEAKATAAREREAHSVAAAFIAHGRQVIAEARRRPDVPADVLLAELVQAPLDPAGAEPQR